LLYLQGSEVEGLMSEAMDRRSFSVAMAYAMLGGAAITITGCGSETPTSTGGYGSGPVAAATPTATPMASGDKVGLISANHGHQAVITAAELVAGGGLSLDIRGDADHTHTITLSGTQVVSIGHGGTVTVQSTSTSAHHHDVTFN
jgi:hypothetical protein